MTKNEYLKAALKAKNYGLKSWVLSCFTEAVVTEKGKFYPYRLYKDKQGYYTLEAEMTAPIRITDTNPNKKLFPDGELYELSADTVINLEKTMKDTAKRFLANAILLTHNFGDKIPYMGSKLSFSVIERIVYDKLIDDSYKEDGIHVREFLAYHTSAVYLQEFSLAFTVAATEKNTSAPTGLNAYRAKLLKEYGDKIKDPIVQVEFEKKLVEFANEYLKDDPSQGRLMKGKMAESYKKMNMTYGAAKTFDGYSEFRPEGLEEGMPTDSKTHADKMNNLRTGSEQRARGTQQGGIVPKIIASAINHIIVTPNDCGTKQTREVTIIGNPDKYSGMYTMNGSKPVLLDTAKLKEYDVISLRDPMYCKNKNDTYCAICAGDKLGKSDKSIGLIATEIGMATLGQKLKAFHVTNLKTEKVDLLSVIS